jgi:molybdopterin/thiamine biosynthesis adenylyltransferase
MFTFWKLKKVFKGQYLRIQAHGGGVADRQSKIPGFSQKIISSLTVLVAGAGGLASASGEALARKGVGRIIFTDEDTVDPSNLNRQKFYKRDIYKNKAHCLARNIANESFLGTEAIGIALNFMDAIRSGLVPEYDCIICNIDNEVAREEIVEFALVTKKPIIVAAVDMYGEGGYVFVQKPGMGCWGCAFPRAKKLRDDLESVRTPCPGTPAILDILLVVGGATVYALDCIFMERPIAWNYREFHLAGFMPDTVKFIERLPSCHLCSEYGQETKGTNDV